jgi:hypothetical protein
MIRKIVSYPAWVGPMKAFRETNRLQAEIHALPGYKDLQREYARYYWTSVVWMLGVGLGIGLPVIYVLKALGFGS